MNIEELALEANKQSNRVQSLVDAGHLKVTEGELLLSKISVLCTELAYLNINDDLEVDERIAADEKMRKLQLVIDICKSL